MMNDTTLLRCGFCGGSNVYLWNDGRAEWATHKVVCPDCCAEGPETKDESEATALWNRRAPDPRIAAAEEMAKALEDAMRCETCEGSGRLLYPPACNCYGELECIHPETEDDCAACLGSGTNDMPLARSALAAWNALK